jgi:hypothetical protein
VGAPGSRLPSCMAAVQLGVYSLDLRGAPPRLSLEVVGRRTAHCTLHTAHCTLHTAHCTLHTAHCTLHTPY